MTDNVPNQTFKWRYLMDTSKAIVTVHTPDDNDMRVIGSWLETKESDHTRRAYRRIALNMLAYVNKSLADITLMDLQGYMATLEGENSTVALTTNVLKSLFTFTSETEYTRNVGKLLHAPKVRDELAQRILSETDAIRLVTLETNPRNHAMLRLLYHAGLRVSELVNLKWEDVRETDKGAVLDVLGKGEKLRHVVITKSMYDELRTLDGAYLGKDRYVFQSRKGKAGTVPMDTRQVERMVLDAAKRAGIAGNVSPHWLRHSHVSHAIDNDTHITVLSTSVNHTNLNTTMR